MSECPQTQANAVAFRISHFHQSLRRSRPQRDLLCPRRLPKAEWLICKREWQKKGRSEDQPFSNLVAMLLLVTGTWSVHNFNTTVLRFANTVCGFNARTRFTEGFAGDRSAADAARFKIRTDSFVATLGQTDVVAGGTRFVSVTSQHDLS